MQLVRHSRIKKPRYATIVTTNAGNCLIITLKCFYFCARLVQCANTVKKEKNFQNDNQHQVYVFR
jgi:hypothetical protein